MKKTFTVILILCLVSLILEYKLGISDFRFTPILQKILNVINPAKNAHLKTVFSKSCNKSFTIDSRFILKEQWQPIENVSDTHNVYSAYYHRAGSSPIIKIIGNFNRYYKPISLYPIVNYGISIRLELQSGLWYTQMRRCINYGKDRVAGKRRNIYCSTKV